MNASDDKWDPNVSIDFSLTNAKRRRSLFYKRPKNFPIPVGVKWTCVCGVQNVLTDKPVQYCASCGSKLQLQEATDEANVYHTAVIVSHFYPSRRK